MKKEKGTIFTEKESRRVNFAKMRRYSVDETANMHRQSISEAQDEC